MARSDGAILDGGGSTGVGSRARVTDGEVHVKATVAPSSGTQDVNIIEVGGNSVTTTVPVSGTVSVGNLPASQTVDDGGLTISIDDGGGSITVDVGNFPAVQPVSDNGGTLSIDDGGGSVTVDGSVAVTNFPAFQAVTDGGLSLSIDDGGNIITVDGNVGLTLQVTEDVAVVGSPTLVPVAAERDDVLSELTEADGDWGHLRMDKRGALWVRNGMEVQALSQSTEGKQITVVGTTHATRTQLHAGPASGLHKVFMVAHNFGTTDQVLTVYWGDAAGDSTPWTIPTGESRVIAIGQAIGNANISASAQTASFVHVTGFVEVYP